jgi:hypothetical protein
MLKPLVINAAIAGMPSAVAGIFTSRLGRAMRSCNRVAAAIVASVSRANSGATSIDTKPSLPCELSKVGRNTASASVTSWMASSQ